MNLYNPSRVPRTRSLDRDPGVVRADVRQRIPQKAEVGATLGTRSVTPSKRGTGVLLRGLGWSSKEDGAS